MATLPDGRAQCDGVTKQTRQCERAATEHYIHVNGFCIKHYCRQHSNGAGVMRLLLPFSWEYDRVESYVYYADAS